MIDYNGVVQWLERNYTGCTELQSAHARVPGRAMGPGG